MKRFKLFIVSLLALVAFTGCSASKDVDNSKVYTDVTYSTKLSEDYEGKSFTSNGIGEVKFSKSIDGDTSIFTEGSNTFKLRYYGINTPESTAQIEPWGRAASSFTKARLSGAEKVVLQKDPASEKFDSSGKRYMGLVWIKDNSNPDFYCLNLLLVENGYSKNQLFDSRSPYLTAFQNAGKSAESKGLRVNGQEDTSIDTSGKVYEVTISELLKDFYKYNDGRILHVTGVITTQDSDNFYLEEKGANGDPARSIYCYAGFNNAGLGESLGRGTEVRFYCKAGIFNDTPQLSNIFGSFYGERKFEVLSQNNQVSPKKLTGNETFEELVGSYVTADLKVDHIINSKNNNDFTVVCKFIGNESKKLDIRCRSIHDTYYGDLFKEGTNIRVKGPMDRFEPDSGTAIFYQIRLGSVDRNDLDVELIK